MKRVIRVPKERIGVIAAELKRGIEKRIGADIQLAGNEVCLEGSGLALWTAEQVIVAIARGFAPAKAYKLLHGEELMVIDLSRCWKTKKARERIKGRIIGRKGKARKVIESMTGVEISVYGKTVSLIGHPESLTKAARAVKMLIEGAEHSSVYSYLERVR
jgi:ribosomal RNA assembly protein